MAVSQLTQAVHALLTGDVPDLETLTGKAAVLVSRRQARREEARQAAPQDPVKAAMGKLLASGIPFKVEQHGDDRQPGTGTEG